MDVTGEKSGDPSLDDNQALELARIALRLEDYYGSPQDVEWAIDQHGRIFVLQCRPLKQTEGGDGGHRTSVSEVSRELVILQGGATASSGVACGPAYLLLRHGDALKFPRGAVLVTAQALPRWAALLNRAAAVVTEQGSAAGHLANVAREFGVPAIFGVPSATQVLRHDELVTIDADGLTIYRGCVESLLAKSGEGRKNLMKGSPVYEVLRERHGTYCASAPSRS